MTHFPTTNKTRYETKLKEALAETQRHRSERDERQTTLSTLARRTRRWSDEISNRNETELKQMEWIATLKKESAQRKHETNQRDFLIVERTAVTAQLKQQNKVRAPNG